MTQHWPPPSCHFLGSVTPGKRKYSGQEFMAQAKVKGGRASSTDKTPEGSKLLLSKETILSVCLSLASEERVIISSFNQITGWKEFQILSDSIVSLQMLCTCWQQCRQNLLLDFSGFVMGSFLSLKFCYIKVCYIKVFLEEEVFRNSLEEEIEIAAWKVFASSHLLTDPGEDD